MTFVDALWEFMFGSAGTVPTGFAGSSKLLFAGACATMGMLIVILDWVFFSLQGNSVLKFQYPSFWSGLRLLILWGIGAGVGGYLGSSLSIFQLSQPSAIGVGIGWPLILPRLLDASAKPKGGEDDQPPEGGVP